MQRLHMAAAGNADENINLIDHRFQAEALRALRGYDVGVLDNSFYDSGHQDGTERVPNQAFMWELSAVNILDIAVGRGMATAYGVDMKSELTVHLTATAPSVGVKYVFIYLEWDLSNPVEGYGKIDIHDNGSSASWTPSRQDNLITNPIGVYQLPLYRLAINTTGIISDIADWGTLGVLTIGRPLCAEHAKQIDFADDVKNICGKPVQINDDKFLHGDLIVCRKKYIYFSSDLEGVWLTSSGISLSETVKKGDRLQIEIAPNCLMLGTSESTPRFETRICIVSEANDTQQGLLCCEIAGIAAQERFDRPLDGSTGCMPAELDMYSIWIKFTGEIMAFGGEAVFMYPAPNKESNVDYGGIKIKSVAKLYE